DDRRNLIAAKAEPRSLFHHGNPIDDVAHLRLPENRLQNTARGGRSHHRITHPLDLHLWPREAGIVTPHANGHSVVVGHGERPPWESVRSVIRHSPPVRVL